MIISIATGVFIGVIAIVVLWFVLSVAVGILLGTLEFIVGVFK